MDHPKPVLFSRSIVLLIATLLLSGVNCHGNKVPQQPSFMTGQIIVKFKLNTDSDDIHKLLFRLNKDLVVELEYVRSMSGSAHVIKISNLEDQKNMERILRDINNHKDVEYAEANRIMTIQN
ncbi:MAG: hypothetical protein MJE63_10935 [Proteobacteria bacterium]|nr:hypothetical protein [Pseudomonadota bacterium]